ncbi:MAG: autotransporter domain-containing protein [Maricaulaceae bacterium]
MTSRFLLTTALSTLAIGWAGISAAQVSITDARTTTVTTSTEGPGGTPDDVTLDTAGSITVTTAGPAAAIDSDNDLTLNGAVSNNDTDGAIGVELVGGNSGDLTVNSSLLVQEDYTPTDTDGDQIVDGTFAQGTGRTGILISGASPFVGNITTGSGATIGVEGNNSFGIQLASTAGLTGDMVLDGTISVIGDNSIGLGIAGQVIGNLANSSSITTRGTGAQSVNISGDVTGGFSNDSNITNTGYRFTTRPQASGRALLDADDLRQGGAAIEISSNISEGILLDQITTTTTDANGDTFTAVTARSNINQFGSAPAILIDGQGTPISIGRVSAITNPANPNYDENLIYAFVNEGDLSSAGIYDDVNTTVFEVHDAALVGGINNSGTMRATSYRSGNNGTADAAGFTGSPSVIILGNNAIADQINNTGIIAAAVIEADDTIYADTANIIAPRQVTAVAVDIAASANLGTINNTGIISAVMTARDGTVTAIRDTSGTLHTINNSGQILAAGVNSDALNNEATSFTTVAMDLSANTSGVTITQTAAIDTDPTDSITPADPSITGDILLGSGNDTVDVSSGAIVGDIDFGNGADTLTLSGGSSYSGALSDSDGALTITVADSTLANISAVPLNVTSASFDATSAYTPTLDGATGTASTLVASGNVSFANGATIAPVLSNIIGNPNNTFQIANAGNLTIGASDISTLAGTVSPFLYDTVYALDPNDPNTLLVTLNLRPTSALGLDTVQTAAFTSAFEALGANSGLGDAFVNITDGATFNQSLNQLLPEFAAAARQFVVANVDGATGAVGSHLDNVRRSQDRPGGAWIQEFAYFADRDLAGLSEQYRGSGFGMTGGIDTALGPLHAVGVSVGFASTEIESVADMDDPLDVLTVQLGTYAGYQTGKLGFEAYAGVGYNDFESERKISVGNFASTSEGDWSGTHYNASLRAGYDVDFSDKFYMRPAVSVDYLSLSEKAYTESGETGIALDIDKRKSESGSATAMLNFGGKFMGKRTWVRPGLRVGYRNDFIHDGVITTGRFAGLTTPFEIESEKFPDSGFLLGFSIAAGSEYSSFSFDFDSDIRDGFIRHTGRVVLRLLF